ncbi:MAG TPA: SMP-30/gluconolactonase/LRE family protein [Thermoleophilaceae bacterium]|nr:SMP-30/gluconolactonase/LRE family protein [Thermoleophilaceae bacterium]
MATALATELAPPPGPPELLPGRPDAIVDLQTEAGVALVGGQWRYSDARVEEVEFVELGSAEDPLGPGTVPNRTFEVLPHAEAADFDDSSWTALAPAETMRRLADGRVCFNWYRIEVTLPEHVGDVDVTGATVVFEVVVDDYAEVWVNGSMPHALGDTGGPVVAGFNAPNRVVLTRDARPGDRFTIAVFGMNGPISAAPANYIWMRTATLDVYAGGAPRPAVERVAGGFEFTEGPVWSPDGALLFSSPNTNSIYRLDPELRTVTLFRPKSGYTGVDIGRYVQPGSNGLTFDPDGRLVICQHGNRRVLRVNPHGDTTVIADSFEGRRLNSPNDVVCRSDGSVWFTDPPFGRPGMADDPDRELDFSGVFRVSASGEVAVVDAELEGPNGIAFSPDERTLYVGNWDPAAKVVVRYELSETGEVLHRAVLFDMTDAPGEDAIDGIKVDVDGNLYVCGPGGIWVISPAGERLDLIELPEAPHNLAFGGEDGRDLYVTALTSVYRLRREVPGITPFTERSER